MIKEVYVSYGVAKLLKDKGFPQKSFDTDCNTCYKYSNGAFCNNAKSMNSVAREVCVMAPTQAMAMAWLREEKNLYIEIRRNLNTFYFKWYIQEGAVDRALSEYKYESYEEAVEAALLWVLQNLVRVPVVVQ